MEEIVLIGGGGHALSVADAIISGKSYKIAGYTDVSDTHIPLRYLGTDDMLGSLYKKGVLNAAICIGYLGTSDVREILYKKVKDIGFNFPVIKDPSAVIADGAVIGDGTFIGKNVVVNVDAFIGKMCIINTGAIIEHGCYVGDFAHIAVGAVLCGRVTVERAAFVGANATIIQGRKVLEHQIVGAGVTLRSIMSESEKFTQDSDQNGGVKS